MKQKTTIQKTIAVFLLLVFSISIAPKSYFHDLIANHKDYSSCSQLHTRAALHTQGYNCHFDDLVVTAPFLSQAEQPFVFVKFCFKKQQASFYSSLLQSFSQHKESRGPPSA